jgi:prepilin-type processing-associated H-X9-DG protein
MDTPAVEKFSSTSYAYSMAFYHSPDQINAMSAAADTWSNPQPVVPQYLGRVKTPGQKILVGEWTSNHRPAPGDNGWWNWLGSRNCLFVDGHAEYRAAISIHAANDGWPDANLTRDGVRGGDVD